MALLANAMSHPGLARTDGGGEVITVGRSPPPRLPAKSPTGRRLRDVTGLGDRRRHPAVVIARTAASRERALQPENASMARLSDKIVIVTGACDVGIGQAIAAKLAAEGDASSSPTWTRPRPGDGGCVAGRRRRSGLTSPLAKACRRWLMGFPAEQKAASTSWSTTLAGPVDLSDPADWLRVIAVNLYGVLHTSKAVLPIMAEQGSEAVVNLGSGCWPVGSSGEAVYSAAKGGSSPSPSLSLAREMARHQARVNCVCPGPTDNRAVRVLRGAEAARGPHHGDSVPAARPAWRTLPAMSSRSSPRTRRPSLPG